MEALPSTPSSLFERLSPPAVVAAALSLLMLSFFVQELFGQLLGDSVWAIALAGLLCYLVLPAVLWKRAGALPGPRMSLAEDLGSSPLLASEAGWIAVLAVAMLLPLDRLGELNQRWVEIPEAYTHWQEQLLPSTPLETIGLYLGLGLVVPIGEEVLFRGMVQQAFRRLLGPVAASVAAGTVFGLLHLQPWFLLPLIATGVLLGLVYEITDTLWAPVMLHALYNCAVLTLWLVSGDGDTPGSQIVLAGLAVVGLALSVLALARLSRIRDDRWRVAEDPTWPTE